MSNTEKDLGEVKKIENDELEEVSGGGRGYGKATEHQTIWQRLKNFFGFGKREEAPPGPDPYSMPEPPVMVPPFYRGNYFDYKGVYHINCIKCGKEVKALKTAPKNMYACEAQVCDECKKMKNQ